MWRIRFVFLVFVVLFLAIIARLFYWQVISTDKLSLAAYRQYTSKVDLPAVRGEIKTADGLVLATNETAYSLIVNKNDLKLSFEKLAELLAPLFTEPEIDVQATISGLLKPPNLEEIKRDIVGKLSTNNGLWVPIFNKISNDVKIHLEKEKIDGLNFDLEQKRYYPESSMAAQLLGFIGSDYNGQDKGYFGLEGYYDRELTGISGIISQEKDVYGRPILIGEKNIKEAQDGRTLVLNIDRTLQYIVEQRLQEGITKYGAKAGSVVIMDPTTGGIMAMASTPYYDSSKWYKYDPNLYKNPVVADFYEPGSTFKVLVMAAGLDMGVVSADTKCNKCSGPREIGGYTIRTWNNKYYPQTTMTEVLEHSDNTGMVFVQERLQRQNFLNYLKKFGLGESSGIDLEEETYQQLRPDNSWHTIDLATSAFGQGIAVTGIQMIRAVSAVANGGILMEPHVVNKVITSDGSTLNIKPKAVRRVISERTSKIVTEMLINAVDKGEAKWAKPQGYRIAGKTGTAQIPVAGHYDSQKTIASFVGFAPADKPRFVMLVRLTEPTSSPWGSETAAPLFFTIAREIFSYLGIAPQ